ncbi:MAG: NifB/NifX family molybdenum-iron cluster-binding protein [Anaerovoracaceae bacterium]
MLKIAIASEGNQVTGHFGHCESFLIFNVEEGKIISEESLPNPGHRPGFLPNYLADNGVNVIISGGMGGGAVDIFNSRNVQVVLGATGDAKAAAESYLKGDLVSTGSICHDHAHAHECNK